MAPQSTRLPALFAELKRRRVFRVAGAYAVAAFAVIQAADAVFPRIPLPDWTVSLVVWLAILGFPVALVLAWAFDWTGEGVVRTTDAQATGAPEATSPPPTDAVPPAARARSPVAYVGVGILVALVGFAAYSRVQHGGAAPAGNASAAPDIHSIAVLPLTNLSADSADRYLGDGVSEEILNGLTRLPGVTVVGRTSSFRFRGPDVDAAMVGRELGVGALLSGTVQRDGDAIRITVELVDTKTGRQLWFQRYDREMGSLFALEDDIAHSTTEALRMQFAGGTMVRRGTASPEAHDLVLRANALALENDEASLERSVALYRQAIALDSTYAGAWAGLSRAYGALADAYRSPLEMLPLAERAALRAVALDDSLATGHVALADVRFAWQWRFADARREFQRALALDPGSAFAHQEYGSLLLWVDQDYAGAERELKTAAELDPLNPDVVRWQLTAAVAEGANDRALQLAHRLERLAGSRMYYKSNRTAEVYAAMGRWSDCVRQYDGIPDAQRQDDRFLLICRARLGQRDEVFRAVARLRSQPYVDRVCLADVFTALGDETSAFAELEGAVDDRSANILEIRALPWLASLRTDPRFARILARVGLPPTGPPAGAAAR